jgi:hypothetical protein
MRSFLASIVLLVMTSYGAAPDLRGDSGERSARIHLEFDRRILDGSETGVLFPAFVDFDGDGKTDLLVGVQGLGHGRLREKESGEGGLLVYLNRGTNAAPVYAKPFWFDKGVPSGRIPRG